MASQRKEEGDSPFAMEDLLYYMKRAEEKHLNLDLGEVKQYFPCNLVLSGIFKIFQDLFGNCCIFKSNFWHRNVLIENLWKIHHENLFSLTLVCSFFPLIIPDAGLRFEEINNADVWHETVCVYSVLDFSSSELVGYLYLDMFSRLIFYLVNNYLFWLIESVCKHNFSNICSLETENIPKPVFYPFKMDACLLVEHVRCWPLPLQPHLEFCVFCSFLMFYVSTLFFFPFLRSQLCEVSLQMMCPMCFLYVHSVLCVVSVALASIVGTYYCSISLHFLNSF